MEQSDQVKETARVYKEKLIKVIEAEKLYFIEDACVSAGMSKTTFYYYYPKGLDDFNELKALLDDNKIALKKRLRNKWELSDKPALQIGLMKLVGSEEERKRLTSSYQDVTTKGNAISADLSNYSNKELRDRLDMIDSIQDHEEDEDE